MMEIDEDDVLRSVANGGSMDFSVWPALLPRIISRIEKIAHDEFPIPNLPPPPPTVPSSSAPPPTTTQAPDADVTDNFLQPLPSSPDGSSPSSQDANKENNPAPTETAPTSAPAHTPTPAPPTAPGTLPAPVMTMLTEITSTLQSTFPTYPPHTIQRLSELVLTPKNHYRSLPTYLHALDRVVHVTSGLNVYPLPPAVPDLAGSSVLSNGVSDGIGASSTFAAPGSDEALGGALLTLIPWLQPPQQGHGGASPHSQASGGLSDSPDSGSGGNGADLEGQVRTESTEKIDGPNGMGSIETVSVSVNGIPSMGARSVGVTQGEILRQEQRAGVVPINQLPAAGHHPVRHANVHAAASSARISSESPTSSATLEDDESGVKGSEETETASATGGAGEDEKPHPRGPEEIGAEDMGPQPSGPGSASANLANSSGGSSNPADMQGINIEAAVGRKASSPVKEDGEDDKSDSEQTAGADKMDVEEEGEDKATPKDGSSTPKREAEDELEGASKKMKEDPEKPSGEAEDDSGKMNEDTASPAQD